MTATPAPLLVVTDGQLTGGRPLVEVVAAAVAGGATAVLLREKALPRERRAELAEAIRALLPSGRGTLIVASDPTIPADGVHLAAADPLPRPRPPLLGRSCHSTADVTRAAQQGCTYATLSPVTVTASKPGYGPALGMSVFADLPLPTWALGGVDETNAADCLRAGASGVAVMGAIMRAPDPATLTSTILRRLESALP